MIDSAIGKREMTVFSTRLRSGNDRCAIVLLVPAAGQRPADLFPIDLARDEIVATPCEGKQIRRAVDKMLDSAGGTHPEVISIGNLALNRNSHELRGDGMSVRLTPMEFRLMFYLARRQGDVVSAEELLEKVWEFFPGTGSSDLVRSHVRNLRNKLRTVTGREDLVQTVPRRGYRLA